MLPQAVSWMSTFAMESGNMTKNQMLVQTGAQMLSSTKSMTQMAAQMLG